MDVSFVIAQQTVSFAVAEVIYTGDNNAQMIIIDSVTTTAQHNDLIGAYTIANLCIFGNGTEQISANLVSDYDNDTGTITFTDSLGSVTIRIILIA